MRYDLDPFLVDPPETFLLSATGNHPIDQGAHGRVRNTFPGFATWEKKNTRL